MAEKDNEPSRFDPRHRIIGAIIVVSLAVIFVPMILDERDAPSQLKEATGIPQRPGESETTETKVVVTPLDELGADKRSATPEAGAAVAPAPEAPKPEGKPGPSPKPETTPAPSERATPTAPSSEPVEKAPPAGAAAGWYVQVGVYSNRENAQRVVEKLKGRGFAVVTDTVKIEGGKATRLRVGPYRDRGAAERGAARIEKETGLHGIVRQLR